MTKIYICEEDYIFELDEERNFKVQTPYEVMIYDADDLNFNYALLFDEIEAIRLIFERSITFIK